MRWFCSLKAYGDLVIACNCVRNANAAQNGLLVGSHLRQLLDILKFNGTFRFIEIGESVPAFFDTKKCGYFMGLSNGFVLRKKIQASIQQKSDLLVFDALGLRQRFLGWPFRIEAISSGRGMHNIYLDYAQYLGLSENDIISRCTRSRMTAGNVYVFPDSRIKDKVLPDCLVNRIAEENIRHGKETILVKVGKPVDLPQFSALRLQWVDGFDQLTAQVNKADSLVSADSLPAHLAEYIGTPVFVFTPTPNDYWMPLSSYNGCYFSVFSSLTRYKKWINLI